MIYRIRHVTSYEFSSAVTASHHIAHLIPRGTPSQRVRHTELQITPPAGDSMSHVDNFGNRFLHFSLDEPHTSLTVTASSEVELLADSRRRRDRPADIAWEAATTAGSRHREALEFLLPSPLVPDGEAATIFAREVFTPRRSLRDGIEELTRRIHREFRHQPGATHAATPADQVMQRREGVCQDFAHVAIAALRSVGLPARYVSGYVETMPPPGEEQLVGSGCSHGWASVLHPDGHWIDFDPANDLVEPASHVTVAWGRDHTDVIPIKGVIASGGAVCAMTVSVDVERHAPRSTTRRAPGRGVRPRATS